ncbi:2-hydroxyacyl-CoA dehydratase [Thermosyntropha sp.]|uniref:2-hydroxyacyl-CoA dehydratase family protein n=1 Tax=Thermosyntropha sp. TaxID=2740820 RepID=UPI0025D34FFE|nr:2-hydroxyacyl-CoA dehydratase [Thermosyntropha sp.]MBO8159843.1 2-hydroxyacyl-CoA dehydratase [Thermosyntropha sp.]
MGKIGFTTTIPVEVIIAAGKQPVDLNNIFITSKEAGKMVELAEEAGYPRNTCGWIKGLYAVSQENDLEAVVAVMQGDCSNTQALMETLQLKGIKIIPFAFPFERDKEMLKFNIERLMDYFEVNYSEVMRVKKELDEIRKLCHKIDEMTWKDNLVSSFENHYYLVSSSDFNGSPANYQEDLERFIKEAKKRKPYDDKMLRLAYIGVPPIFTDFYQALEEMGARVVYNEVQRQFSMPFSSEDIFEQYLKYTYPYGAFARLDDILEQISLRRVDGVIHYTQTFCFRQIEDLIYREKIKIPFLTLEGDKPGKLDARSRMRLEAFINMLKR